VGGSDTPWQRNYINNKRTAAALNLGTDVEAFEV